MPLVTLARCFCTPMRTAPLRVGVCLLSWFATAAQAQSTTYWLDPGHTRVHWEVMHFGTSTSRGRFDDVRGSIELDATAGTGEVSIEVRTASVNTGVAAFDTHLKGRDFFNVEQFPRARFVGDQFVFLDASDGQDVTKPARLGGGAVAVDADQRRRRHLEVQVRPLGRDQRLHAREASVGVRREPAQERVVGQKSRERERFGHPGHDD